MPELFTDGRGAAMRATWHAEAGVVVMSFWRGDACVGTVRLSPEEADRLASFLHDVAPPIEC